MNQQRTSTARLSRLLGTLVGAVLVTAALPVAASAQTADPPGPTPIDAFCANVPDTYDPFDDVVATGTFHEAIRCLGYGGITTGVGPRTYAPSMTVTRQQMASFIAQTMDTAVELQLGTDVPEEALTPLPAPDEPNPFTDVSDGNVHATNIRRLAAADITTGGPGELPDTAYGPLHQVSRGQMATFVIHALEHLTGTTRVAQNDYFTDDEGSTHEPNINALAEVGIVVGAEPGAYRPTAPVTRAQMSAFLLRSLANLAGGNVIAPLPPPEAAAPR